MSKNAHLVQTNSFYHLKFRINIFNVLEYVNAHRLQQDHPCVLEVIRREFIHEPAPAEEAYKGLHNKDVLDPSDGQATAIMRLLRNQVTF
jgi:hypothetical protein